MPASPPSRRIARTLAIATACGLSWPALATPVLRCQIEQQGELVTLDVRPAADPYSFKATDIRGLFGFRAVVVGAGPQVEYVTLYTYYRKGRQSILLHRVKYLAPQVQGAGSATTLTGEVQLYSPDLGREIQYSCRLVGGGA